MSHDVDIKSLDRAALSALMEELGEPPYRVRQIVKWLYQRGVSDFAEMTDLSAGLRQRLAERCFIGSLELAQKETSALDGTARYLWRLTNEAMVESVGLPADGRLTVCFSTQAGCAMGCSFCATGEGGFARDLTSGEIFDQVINVGRDFGVRVTNAVAMGQGEPFANYDATLEALRLMNSPDGLGIGARHLTVSTCGLIRAINRFATEPEQFTLAVSLHSAVQATRDKLMPGVRGQRLLDLRAALIRYGEKTGRRPSLECAIIPGVNDTASEVAALVDFARGMLCHVNLIAMNPATRITAGGASPSGAGRVRDSLAAAGVEVSVRAERGSDIEAACGQLTQRHAPSRTRPTPPDM